MMKLGQKERLEISRAFLACPTKCYWPLSPVGKSYNVLQMLKYLCAHTHKPLKVVGRDKPTNAKLSQVLSLQTQEHVTLTEPR